MSLLPYMPLPVLCMLLVLIAAAFFISLVRGGIINFYCTLKSVAGSVLGLVFRIWANVAALFGKKIVLDEHEEEIS